MKKIPFLFGLGGTVKPWEEEGDCRINDNAVCRAAPGFAGFAKHIFIYSMSLKDLCRQIMVNIIYTNSRCP